MIGDPLLGGGDDDESTPAPVPRRDAPPTPGPDEDAGHEGAPAAEERAPEAPAAEEPHAPGAPDTDAPRWRDSGGDTPPGGGPTAPPVPPSDDTGRDRGGDRARPGGAFPRPTEPLPARTRQVPAPVIPPGGLIVPPTAASGDVDPLWAATVSGPGDRREGPAGPEMPVPVAPVVARHDDAEGELARLARVESRPPPAAGGAPPGPAGDLTATTAMPTAGEAGLAATTAIPHVGQVAAGDLTATTAMPGVARAGGSNDTMVMPAVTAPAPGAEHAAGFAKAQRRHRRRWWRRSFKALLALVFLGLVYVGVNFALVLRTAHADQARPVDVIVVLGAAQYDGRPSPQLRARLDHTIDLWNQGLAGSVFVTGGNQPGDRFTEAEASRNYLVEHGVPADVIQMEDTAHSTWESFANLASVAERQNWERVLIVTDPFHSLRSRLIAQELGFTAYTSPTRTSPVQGGEEVMKELKEALGISLGRIIGFERLWKLTG